jgi:hypothetical protein
MVLVLQLIKTVKEELSELSVHVLRTEDLCSFCLSGDLEDLKHLRDDANCIQSFTQDGLDKLSEFHTGRVKKLEVQTNE